jgi:hypothetical protein
MEEIEFSRYSWHYRFTDFFRGGLKYDTDICDYRTKFMVAIVIALVEGFVGYWVLRAVFDFLFGVGFSIFYGQMMFGEMGVIVGVILGMLAILCAIVGLAWLLFEFNGGKAAKAVNGLTNPLGEMYRSHKEKYCKRVVFK